VCGDEYPGLMLACRRDGGSVAALMI